MATLLYWKYSASMFLNRSGFKVLSQIFMENADWLIFDKEKQAWLLIISSVKVFESLLSTFFRYYHV